jgi:hypothetical protein
MILQLRILAEPDESGNAAVIEKQEQAGPQIGEVVRTAREYVLNSPPPGAQGFSLRDDQGREFLRWFSNTKRATD